MPTKTHIDWLDSSTCIDLRIGQRIDNQVKATQGAQYSLIQELSRGIYALTIPHKNLKSADIKKIADKVQYSILSDFHNNEAVIRISYNQVRNLCHNDSGSNWAKFISTQENNSSKVFLIFFYHNKALSSILERSLEDFNFSIKERQSNRILIITKHEYYYPLDTTRLVALSLWREQNLESLISMQLHILEEKFAFFPRLFHALKNIFRDYFWEFSHGNMSYNANGLIKSFDYATLVDDIFFAHMSDNPESYIKNFTCEDLDCQAAFPIASVRSLVHLKARPFALSSLQNGYVLAAALESKGKQQPAQTHNNGNALVFNHWLRRSTRHLYRQQYQARVILGDSSTPRVFSVIGEQVASIAIYPELVKGLLEQLSINFQNTVRLIAHNEDVLTIASEEASWNEINKINEKASLLFKMISPDGTDPLSLFEQALLPPHGVGTFHLSVVPEEYFELLETAFSMKHSMAPGHDHYLLGLSYECLKEWGMAVTEFQKALRQDSKDSTIQNALGCALMEIGQPESALPFLKRAFDAQPDDADLANNLGRLYLLVGNTSDAIGAFETAVKLSPGSADYLANLGTGYLEASRIIEAVEILNKAVRCDPGFASAHEMLAEVYLLSGEEKLARQHALLAYQENPMDANIANLLWRLSVGKKEQSKS